MHVISIVILLKFKSNINLFFDHLGAVQEIVKTTLTYLIMC